LILLGLFFVRGFGGGAYYLIGSGRMTLHNK
jgi:hypothetical protein